MHWVTLDCNNGRDGGDLAELFINGGTVNVRVLRLTSERVTYFTSVLKENNQIGNKTN